MVGLVCSNRECAYRTFIADDLDVPVQHVMAFVLGGHGDSTVALSRN